MIVFVTFLPIDLAIDKADMPEKRAIDGAMTKIKAESWLFENTSRT